MSLLLLQGSEQQRKRVVLCDSLVQMLDLLNLTTELREVAVESDLGEELDEIILRMHHFLTVNDSSATSFSDLNGVSVLYSYLILEVDNLSNWSDDISKDLLIYTLDGDNYLLSSVDSLVLSLDSIEILMNYFKNVNDNLNTLDDSLKTLILYLLTVDDDSETSFDDISEIILGYLISDIESTNSSNWKDDKEINFSFTILFNEDNLNLFNDMTLLNFNYLISIESSNSTNWNDIIVVLLDNLFSITENDSLNNWNDSVSILLNLLISDIEDDNSINWNDADGTLILFNYLFKVEDTFEAILDGVFLLIEYLFSKEDDLNNWDDDFIHLDLLDYFLDNYNYSLSFTDRLPHFYLVTSPFRDNQTGQQYYVLVETDIIRILMSYHNDFTDNLNNWTDDPVDITFV